MTVRLFARTATVTVATGALLLGSLTMAGGASAGFDRKPFKYPKPSLSQKHIPKKPSLVVPHGRKLA